MPICPRCGRDVAHGYRFCPYCGLQLEVVAEVKVLEHEIEELRHRARSCEIWALFFFSVFIIFGITALVLNSFGFLVEPVYRDFSIKMFYSSWAFFAIALVFLVQSVNHNRKRSTMIKELKRRF